MRVGWIGLVAAGFACATLACGEGPSSPGGSDHQVQPGLGDYFSQLPTGQAQPEHNGLPGLMVGVLESVVARAKVPVVNLAATPFDQASIATPLFLGACTETRDLVGTPVVQLETCQLPGTSFPDGDGDPIPSFASTFQLGCDYRIGDRFFEIGYGLTVEDRDSNRAAWDYQSEMNGGTLYTMANPDTDCAVGQSCCSVTFDSTIRGQEEPGKDGSFIAAVDFDLLEARDAAQGLDLSLTTDDLVISYNEDPNEPWDWESGVSPTSGTLSAHGTWRGDENGTPVELSVDVVEPLVLSEACVNEDGFYRPSDLALAPVEFAHILRYASPFADGVVEVSRDDGTCNRIRWLGCGRIAVVPCDWAG